MLYLAHKLMNELAHKDLKKRLLMSSDWVDGKNTATGQAKELKKNIQLEMGDAYLEFSKEVKEILEANNVIKNFAFPSNINDLLFTRTGAGMFYGPHVDAPFGNTKRRDLSFTIFLNNPNEYEGGELILYIPPEKKVIKLQAGEIILYPTRYLHEVNKVSEGERIVCVGWIESQISRDDDRESLSILQNTRAELIAKYGHSALTTNLNVAINNVYKRLMS